MAETLTLATCNGPSVAVTKHFIIVYLSLTFLKGLCWCKIGELYFNRTIRKHKANILPGWK